MVLDKTGEIEEPDTHGTQKEPYPGIDAESWTFCHDDTVTNGTKTPPLLQIFASYPSLPLLQRLGGSMPPIRLQPSRDGFTVGP